MNCRASTLRGASSGSPSPKLAIVAGLRFARGNNPAGRERDGELLLPLALRSVVVGGQAPNSRAHG
jgi:hypothetical protein